MTEKSKSTTIIRMSEVRPSVDVGAARPAAALKIDATRSPTNDWLRSQRDQPPVRISAVALNGAPVNIDSRVINSGGNLTIPQEPGNRDSAPVPRSGAGGSDLPPDRPVDQRPHGDMEGDDEEEAKINSGPGNQASAELAPGSPNWPIDIKDMTEDQLAVQIEERLEVLGTGQGEIVLTGVPDTVKDEQNFYRRAAEVSSILQGLTGKSAKELKDWGLRYVPGGDRFRIKIPGGLAIDLEDSEQETKDEGPAQEPHEQRLTEWMENLGFPKGELLRQLSMEELAKVLKNILLRNDEKKAEKIPLNTPEEIARVFLGEMQPLKDGTEGSISIEGSAQLLLVVGPEVRKAVLNGLTPEERAKAITSLERLANIDMDRNPGAYLDARPLRKALIAEIDALKNPSAPEPESPEVEEPGEGVRTPETDSVEEAVERMRGYLHEMRTGNVKVEDLFDTAAILYSSLYSPTSGKSFAEMGRLSIDSMEAITQADPDFQIRLANLLGFLIGQWGKSSLKSKNVLGYVDRVNTFLRLGKVFPEFENQLINMGKASLGKDFDEGIFDEDTILSIEREIASRLKPDQAVAADEDKDAKPKKESATPRRWKWGFPWRGRPKPQTPVQGQTSAVEPGSSEGQVGVPGRKRGDELSEDEKAHKDEIAADKKTQEERRKIEAKLSEGEATGGYEHSEELLRDSIRRTGYTPREVDRLLDGSGLSVEDQADVRRGLAISIGTKFSGMPRSDDDKALARFRQIWERDPVYRRIYLTHEINNDVKAISSDEFSPARASSLVDRGMELVGFGGLDTEEQKSLQERINNALRDRNGLIPRTMFNKVYFDRIEDIGSRNDIVQMESLIQSAHLFGFYDNDSIPGLRSEIDRINKALGR